MESPDIETHLLLALHRWIRAAVPSIPDPDKNVPLRIEEETRIALPYIKLEVNIYGIPIGQDQSVDIWNEDTGRLERRVWGDRKASVTLQGFGAAAAAWMETLELEGLAMDAPCRVLWGMGITVQSFGPTRSLKIPMDTGVERRYIAEATLAYRVVSSSSGEVPVAEHALVTLTRSSYPGDDSPVTETVDVDLAIDLET